MPDHTTARLALPLIAPGQAQKEMMHNEALALLDLLVQGSVVSVGENAPPADPEVGACWIVGEVPTGAWAEHGGAIADWSGAGWRFVRPREGMVFWAGSEGGIARRIDDEWVVAPPPAAIAEPSGGGMVDAEARAAIGALITALSNHRIVVAG